MGIHSDILFKSSSKIFWKNDVFETKEIFEWANNFEENLKIIGLKPNHRVAYLSEHQLINFLIYETALSLGENLILPCSFKYIKENLFEIINDIKLDYIITDSKILTKWIASKVHITLCEVDINKISKTYIIKLEDKKNDSIIELKGSTILMSSGTTSKSKYIIQTQNNFSTSIHTFANSSLFNNCYSYLNLLPLYFSGGRKVFYSSLKNNLDIILTQSIKVDSFDFDLTAVTPYLLHQLINQNNFKKGFKCICGGAELSEYLILKSFESNIDVYNVYGLTETSSIISFNEPENRKPNTVGKLCSINQYKILNNELFVKGDTVCSYRMENGDTKYQLDKDGWLATNDLVEVDEEQYLKIIGRKSDTFKLSNGTMTTLQELYKIVGGYLGNQFSLKMIDNEKFNIYIESVKKDMYLEIIDKCRDINNNEAFLISNVYFVSLKRDNLKFSKQVSTDSYSIEHLSKLH